MSAKNPYQHVLTEVLPKLAKQPASPAAFASFVVFSEAGYWPGFDDSKIGSTQYAANEQRVMNMSNERAEALLTEYNAMEARAASAAK